MSIVSPGVEVTIIDQSQYLPAPTNSVPLVVVATAQNKANATNTGVAAGTTSANANKLLLITSQRDLVNLYGTPFFYSTTDGTPLQGYELNEYGLLAAYSLLGVTSRCYVLRANVDLAGLVGSTSRPVGNVSNGYYWLNTANSVWGIYEFNSATGKFTMKSPIVIDDSDNLVNGKPLVTLGNIGDYAVNTMQISGNPTEANQFFYKDSKGTWVVLGSSEWKKDIPAVIGTQSNPTNLPEGTITISLSGTASAIVSFTSTDTTNKTNTVYELVTRINALGLQGVSAEARGGKFCLFSNQSAGNTAPYVEFSGTTTLLTAIGITEGTRYYEVAFQWGTSAQMPLWTAGQSIPRPTKSVWMKVGSTGVGLNLAMSQYNASLNTWATKQVRNYVSDWSATSTMDVSGGQSIPAGTLYAQYTFNGNTTVPESSGDLTSPVYIWERSSTGPTVAVGSDTTPTFTKFTAPIDGKEYRMNVYVSEPGKVELQGPYQFKFNPGDVNGTAATFVEAWSKANIPYTSVTIDTSGAIVLTHTEGGEIVLDDHLSTEATGDFTKVTDSNGLLAAAGFIAGNSKVKHGPVINATFSVEQSSTSGSGTGATFTVMIKDGKYMVSIPVSTTPGTGTGYALNDIVTISGNKLSGVNGTNDLLLKVLTVNSGKITGVGIQSGTPKQQTMVQISNWTAVTYESKSTVPVDAPINNTNWFYNVVNQVDILVQQNGNWIGYKNTAFDETGSPIPNGTNDTDPNGPIISATPPTTQSDNTPLSYGDLWINTSDLENYPVISRWELLNGEKQWVLIDNTDQISSNGIVFADARWGTSGAVDPINDAVPTIKSLLSSNYVDLDCVNPSLYPQGMLLFNTRRSGNNVKQFRNHVFTQSLYPEAGAFAPSAPDNITNLPEYTYTWVSVSGLTNSGAPYMGRNAQRNIVVQAMRSAVDTNNDIRDEDNYFNLIAAPNYPELQPNMIDLNAVRGETAYIVGDTPLGLPDDATAVQAWANNSAGATSTGETGLVSRNAHLGIFYPSGLTTDLQGREVVVPASHMMLRTFLRNDTIAYPWLAAAGTRRGNIDNALSIGYLNRKTGEFVSIKTRIGIRDTLYTNQINPLVFFTGIGLLNYGNKNSQNTQSAMDRTNVARLVSYIRRQLTIAARPFVFEPNDSITRQQIAGVVQTLLVDLVAKRGVYDYLVVCDESNNTPSRIDRNELWIDVAIEPVKSAEFIYIPVRILNTGEIGNNAGQ